MSSPYFANLILNTEAEAKKAGFNIITQLNNGNSEVAYEQMDAFVAQGLDMIVAVTDPTTADPVFRRAVEKGIPCVATSAQAMGKDNVVITNILSSGMIAGFLVGDYTARTLYDKFPKDHVFNIGAVVFSIATGDSQSRNTGFYAGFLYALAELDGKPYTSKWGAIVDGYTCWDNLATKGIYDATKDGFRIDLRGYGNGNSPDAPGGQLGASDLIVAHPEIEIMTFDCDPMFPGAEIVLQQNGKTPGEDIYIACMADGTPYGMESIKNGKIIAIGNNSSSMNSNGMIAAARAIFIDGVDMNNIIPNSYTPTVAITIENVDEYFDPDMPMALGMDWELESVDDYNARMAAGTGEPF
jgi:ABC-type sugar transport system, periplasmic component